jgi:hypothetical protein
MKFTRIALMAAAMARPPWPAARPGPGQAQGRPDAAGHRHLRRAGHGHRERLQALRRRAGRQARRPRDRVRQGRRRERPVQGHRQRQQADQARQRRRARRHRALGRGAGHGPRGQGKRHPADRAQRRRRRVTGPLCAPNIFRSSFSNWQPGYAMGEVAAKKGHKNAVTITWKYAAGDESGQGLPEAFEKGGGKVVKDLSLPFPNVEFQALLTEIAAQKPDAVLHLLRRRRRGQVRQGLRRRGPEEEHPAVRRGLPDRRHAGGAGRRRRGPADHAALRRRPEHAEGQRLPQRLRQGLQAAARRLRRAGLRRGADPGCRPERREGRRQEAPSSRPPRCASHDRQPARQVHAGAATTRCRTSTCARWGVENVRPASPCKALADPAAAARCNCRIGPALERRQRTGSAGSAPARRRCARLACHSESLDGLRHLPHPVPERAAVRAAAVPGGQRADADLRDHGRHQPGARQLLHDRRVHGLCAVAPVVGHLRRRLLLGAGGRRGAGRAPGLRARVGLLQLPLRARAPAAGADDLRPDPRVRGAAQPARR